MKSLVDKIARYYRLGLYQEHHLKKLVQARVLTEEQYQEMMGQVGSEEMAKL